MCGVKVRGLRFRNFSKSSSQAMALPPRTKMWLQITNCTELPMLRSKRAQVSTEDIEKAENEVETAKNALLEAAQKLIQNGNTRLDEGRKDMEKKQKELEQAELKLRSMPKVGDDEEGVKPNPFVIVTIDEDDSDTRPVAFTKVRRETVDPVWKETFDEIPLEMLLTGKRGVHMFETKEKDYRPRDLVFSIWHDNGLKTESGPSISASASSWKRDRPSRNTLIGRASWDFADLCSKVNCPEFEQELGVVDPTTGRVIKDSYLTIKVRLCAPKIQHCKCITMKKVIEEEDFCKEEEEEEEEEKEVIRKVVRAHKHSHKKDCFCRKCAVVGFETPSRRKCKRIVIRHE